MTTIPLWWYLIVAAGLFATGAYGALARKNAVNVLMGIELMLNAVNVQTVAFWRYLTPGVVARGPEGPILVVGGYAGQAFAVFVIALAAAEAAVGLALIVAIYRLRRSVVLDDFAVLNG